MKSHLKNVVGIASLLVLSLVGCSSKEEYVKIRTTDLQIVNIDKPKNFYLTLLDLARP